MVEATRTTTTTSMATPTATPPHTMHGRSSSTPRVETSASRAPPLSTASDSLTHAFLSKRRPAPPPSHFTQAGVAPAFTPAFPVAPMRSHTHAGSVVAANSHANNRTSYPSALASLRGYAPMAVAPTANPRMAPSAHANTFSTPPAVTHNDTSGSAHALLALMESKQRSRVLEREHRSNSDSTLKREASAHNVPTAAVVASPSPSVESTASLNSVYRTKREFPHTHEHDTTSSDADSVHQIERSSAGTKLTPTATKDDSVAPKRKFRKATHTIRKEEKAQLEHELAQLQAQMRELQRRALGVSTALEQTTTTTTTTTTAAQTERDKFVANNVLRDALQQQLAHFADAQVLFSAYGMTQVISPISRPIRLGRDRTERLATLTAMQPSKLAAARAFLARRCGNLDVRKPYCEDQRFETARGDYCAVRFSMLQFENVASVAQVFETLRFYFCNIEISISEKIGNITIREDDDDDLPSETISQNRLVGNWTSSSSSASSAATGPSAASGSSKVLLESNTIMFSDGVSASPGSPTYDSALLVAEFVDVDELYPYQPATRVRKDVNAILHLTSYRRPVASTSRSRLKEDELVVVLTRWSHTRLHRPAFAIPSSAVHDMRENMERWGESMHRTIRETLYPAAV